MVGEHLGDVGLDELHPAGIRGELQSEHDAVGSLSHGSGVHGVFDGLGIQWDVAHQVVEAILGPAHVVIVVGCQRRPFPSVATAITSHFCRRRRSIILAPVLLCSVSIFFFLLTVSLSYIMKMSA